MNPETSQFFARGGFGLGNFVFMVREDKVLSATVNIKGQRQILFAHGGAFDMPAGASFTPRAFPERFAFFGAFPQGKVEGIFFFFAGENSRAAHEFINASA